MSAKSLTPDACCWPSRKPTRARRWKSAYSYPAAGQEAAWFEENHDKLAALGLPTQHKDLPNVVASLRRPLRAPQPRLLPVSTALGGTPVTIRLIVTDVDDSFQRAVEAGATVVQPLQDQFWGDRYGTVVDPFGHRWSMGQPLREVSYAEIRHHIDGM